MMKTLKQSISFVLFCLITIGLSHAFVLQTFSRMPSYGILHAASSASATTSTTTESDQSQVLISRAKDFVYNSSGFYSKADETFFSDEFVFRGPFIGPLNKKDYLFTLDECFKLYEAFPDLNPNAWGFSIDPKNPHKVWFMVRNSGTFLNDLTLIPNLPPVKANGAKVEGAPETFSLLFDETTQKVKALTVGYVADRFEGNTKGQGAAFGLLVAAGIPFPKMSNPILQFMAKTTGNMDGMPKSWSSPEDVPDWWPHEEKLAEGM